MEIQEFSRVSMEVSQELNQILCYGVNQIHSYIGRTDLTVELIAK